MKRRLLGATGLEVSEVAFGGVEIGLPYGIGVESSADMLSRKDAIVLLHKALESGINFFDTARLYGESEAIMGEAFNDRRQEIVLATKCRHFRSADGSMPEDRLLKKFIEDSLAESLAALQTDYIDVFMLHQADAEILANGVIAETFAELKKKGVIRAAGASTYQVSETEQAISSGTWDMIQLPFNLLDQRQSACFEKAGEAGVGLVVRSVLLKGLLSDRGKNLHPALSDVESHIIQYEDLLDDRFPDLPTLATKFALSFEHVASVLVGIDKTEYLRQALVTANGRYMSMGQLEAARKLAYPDPTFLNLPHWDRMGWLK